MVYLGTSFVSAFFSAALMYNAREVFRGRDPTMREGLAVAWRNVGTLFAWVVISAVVGVVLRALESGDNPIADLVALLFSVAWSILTYFVVPVVIFEDVSATEMFSRSGETFEQTWGETAGAGFGVGLVTLLFTLAGLAVAAVVFLAIGSTGAGLLVAVAFGALVLLAAHLLGTKCRASTTGTEAYITGKQVFGRSARAGERVHARASSARGMTERGEAE